MMRAMFDRQLAFAGVCPLVLLLISTAAAAASPPIWNPGLEQAAYGRLGRGRAPASIEELRESVRPYLSLSDRQLRNKIGLMKGGAENEAAIRERAQATYNLALLYHLTNTNSDEKTDYGRRSAILLMRYAEVFPFWNYVVCKGECGIWTNWYHADFDTSINLALAYDLLPKSQFDALGASSQKEVRDLLISIVQADLRFRMYTMNWAFFRPLGLVIYGRVLEDPELAHLGYWFFAKHLHEYYTRDDFLAEGTYSYHAQMTDRMLKPRQAFYLNGYSDPPGYVHVPFDTRWDPVRIDDFDLEAAHGDALRRMEDSLRETTLPNGEWPVLNETKHYGKPRGRPPERSQLLGGIGHAILARGKGTSQAQARLDFSPTLSHRHRDALNLILFGRGTEVVGGTAYRKPVREWNMSTLSHNLVVVDEAEQKGDYFIDWTMAPYVPGIGRTMERVVRRRWNEDSENLHNDVRLWEPGFRGFDSVQVVEVDAADAYRGRADRYQRLLAMVQTGVDETRDDFYLLDLFRVRGGRQYDWMLHGGHGLNRLVTSEATRPAVGQLGHLRFKKQAITSASWEARFEYSGISSRLLMAARPATTIFEAIGPRYEYGGLQDHLVVRRKTDAGREEIFWAVHEIVDEKPTVLSVEEVELEGDPGSAVAAHVRLVDGAEDFIIHTLDEGPDYPTHEIAGQSIRMRGRFAHIRMRGEAIEWLFLAQGSMLQVGDELLSSDATEYSRRGRVVGVERRESGHAENAFIADVDLPTGRSFEGTTLFVQWGNGWSWPYRVDHIEGRRIVISEEPGFEMREGNVTSQYFPLEEFLGLESFPGPVSFVLSGIAIRNQAGEEFVTRSADSAPPSP